jgi:ABC-2 type transport system ATP-binding protein
MSTDAWYSRLIYEHEGALSVESRSELMVETVTLRKTYGKVVALEGLSVQIPRAAVGLLGANGAGKSTLIKLLLGLQSPVSGDASVLGFNVRTEPLRMREHVGYMPESDSLPLDVTAADFVGHMAEISGLPARAARLRAAETLYQCGVDEERYRLLREFSTGMKQRVKLAQAIVHDPDLVFLDEPTNGMDPSGRDDMLKLISRIHRDLGITVILSSHLLEDVELVCDYVVMLEQGRLAMTGPLTTLVQGEGDVVVQVDGEVERFIQALEQSGLDVRRRGSELVLAYHDDTVFDTVRDVSIDTNVLLRGVRRDTRTLEDVYLQRMGEQLVDEGADVYTD